MNSPLLTPDEVAQRLHISRITVLNHLRSGALIGTKVGRLWRVSEESLAAFCYPTRSHGLMVVRDAALGQARPETSGVCDSDGVDSHWLDANWDKPLPAYDWGPNGAPAMKPVRYVPGRGLVIEGEKPIEPK